MLKSTKVFIIMLSIQFNLSNIYASDPHASPHTSPVAAPTTTKVNEHKASAANHDKHERKKGKINPEEAYKKLIAGHKRYMNMSYKKEGKAVKDRQRLAAGQEPHTIILSCSDSRVPPELIFDQGLGELFVVRTAGEALDSSAIASIEYAISHLGSNLIVVMGHESCGAVKAALGTINGEDAGSEWLNKLVRDIHPRIKKFSGLPQSEGAIVESWSNVHGVSEDLRARSKIVDDAIKSGDVEIKKSLYHLGSGNVEWRE